MKTSRRRVFVVCRHHSVSPQSARTTWTTPASEDWFQAGLILITASICWWDWWGGTLLLWEDFFLDSAKKLCFHLSLYVLLVAGRRSDPRSRFLSGERRIWDLTLWELRLMLLEGGPDIPQKFDCLTRTSLGPLSWASRALITDRDAEITIPFPSPLDSNWLFSTSSLKLSELCKGLHQNMEKCYRFAANIIRPQMRISL